MTNQLCLTFQRVDGVDDVVVVLEMERVACRSIIDAFNGFNLCFRVYG